MQTPESNSVNMPCGILVLLSRCHEGHILIGLKKQYPVSAHVPNFDFSDRMSRIQKNPVPSLLAEYIVPVKFRFGRKREFLALYLLTLAEGPRQGKRLCFNAS